MLNNQLWSDDDIIVPGELKGLKWNSTFDASLCFVDLLAVSYIIRQEPSLEPLICYCLSGVHFGDNRMARVMYLVIVLQNQLSPLCLFVCLFKDLSFWSRLVDWRKREISSGSFCLFFFWLGSSFTFASLRG